MSTTGDQLDPYNRSWIEYKVPLDLVDSQKQCEDDFFCVSAELSSVRTIFIGWLGIPIVIGCVLSNLFFLIALGVRVLRTTAIIYLFSAILTDTVRLPFVALLHVSTALPISEWKQTNVYRSHMAYFVPVLSVWSQFLHYFMGLCLIGSSVALLRSPSLIRMTSPPERRFTLSSGLSTLTARPQITYRTRNLFLIANLFIALIMSIPNMVKYKLVEIPRGQQSDIEMVYAQIRYTDNYKIHKIFYHSVELLIRIILWTQMAACVGALIVNQLRNKRRSEDKTNCAHGTITSVYFQARRQRMERHLVLALASIWMLHTFVEFVALILVHLELTSLTHDRARLFGIIEFCNLYSTGSRAIACFFFGVYPRRLLTNIHRYWLLPNRNLFTDSHCSTLFAGAFEDFHMPSDRFHVSESKISFSSCLVPLMLNRKEFRSDSAEKELSVPSEKATENKKNSV